LVISDIFHKSVCFINQLVNVALVPGELVEVFRQLSDIDHPGVVLIILPLEVFVVIQKLIVGGPTLLFVVLIVLLVLRGDLSQHSELL